MNIENQDTGTQDTTIIDIRQLTESQFAQLGVSQLAYIKPVMVGDRIAFAIHAANGTPMALAEDQEVAEAAIIQHEMHPASVH